MVYRKGTVGTSRHTLPTEELPAGSKRFGVRKPVLVLTNNGTNGAGEELAYSLRAFKRADAVVGEGIDATLGMAQQMSQPRFVAEDVFGEGW